MTTKITVNSNKDTYQHESNLKLDYKNEIIKQISSKYQTEISDLKGYIIKLNNEVRKSNTGEEIIFPDVSSYINEISTYMNISKIDKKKLSSIDLPVIDELMKYIEDLLLVFNRTVENMTNINYVSPIITLYEKRVHQLENELAENKQKQKRYETEISSLLNENSSLRNELFRQKSEIYRLISMKVINNKQEVVYDEEFIKILDERSKLLSHENQSITVNFYSLLDEYNLYKSQVSQKFNEFNEKCQSYDDLNNELLVKKDEVDELKSKLILAENQIYQCINDINILTIDKETFQIENQRMKHDIDTLQEGLSFYKRQFEVYNN